MNLAPRESRPHAALVVGAAVAESAGLGLEAAHQLVAEAAALVATLRGADEVAELQRRAGLSLLREIVQLLSGGQQVGADDLDLAPARVAVEAARDRSAIDGHLPGRLAQRLLDDERALGARGGELLRLRVAAAAGKRREADEDEAPAHAGKYPPRDLRSAACRRSRSPTPWRIVRSRH